MVELFEFTEKVNFEKHEGKPVHNNIQRVFQIALDHYKFLKYTILLKRNTIAVFDNLFIKIDYFARNYQFYDRQKSDF